MKNLIAEFNRQTSNPAGNETFIFAYDNPSLDDIGVVSLGDEKQQALLLAGTVNLLSKEARELALSYMVEDDPEAFIAAAQSYIAQQEQEKKK